MQTPPIEPEFPNGHDDDVTKLEEILFNKTRKLSTLTNSSKYNLHLFNRNSVYFRSKLSSYNNKLRDLKTIQLIPSFNYFFLKPKSLSAYPFISSSYSAPKISSSCSATCNHACNGAAGGEYVNNTTKHLLNDIEHLPQSQEANGVIVRDEKHTQDLINALDQISCHIYKLQSFDFKFSQSSSPISTRSSSFETDIPMILGISSIHHRFIN